MITEQDAKIATARLSCLRYFPTEPGARSMIAHLFMRMVSMPDQLSWLVQQFIDHVGEWHGPKELRGVFCTRFKPADGIEETSTLAGYSALDSEAGYLEQFTNERRAELEAPRGQAEAAKTLLKGLN